jgi:hypothetical protein
MRADASESLRAMMSGDVEDSGSCMWPHSCNDFALAFVRSSPEDGAGPPALTVLVRDPFVGSPVQHGVRVAVAAAPLVLRRNRID